jgi:hypothetical protein
MNCIQAPSCGYYIDAATFIFSLFFSPFKIWANIVSDYSKLNLTWASDKFPALQGLDSFAGLAVPGQSLSEIWKSILLMVCFGILCDVQWLL